jgi:hypothetical protein
MNDPTLSRPMFQSAPSASSSAAPPSLVPTVGIGSMTTPDQNAQALRNMFSPQAFKRGGEVINGVAHFADGNEVVIPQRRYGGTEPDPTDTRSYRERYGLPALSQFQRDIGAGVDAAAKALVPDERPATQEQKDVGEGRMKAMSDAIKAQRATMEGIEGARGRVSERMSGAPASPSYFGASTPDQYDEARKRREEYDAETLRQAQENLPPPPANAEEEAAAKLRAGAQEALMADQDRRDIMRPGGMFAIGEPPAPSSPAPVSPPPASAPAVPPPNKTDEPIQTNLEAIKARREASDKQREENKWMGILAAGLGMMSSKSRTAAGGIGEGGLQGLQTFAGLEKARREEEANLRHEDYQQQQLALQNKQFGLQQQQLAQQKELTMAQINKDPDTVRTYAVLGGATPGSTPEERQAAVLKGYNFMKQADAVKRAEDLLKQSATDPMLLTPEQKAELTKIVYGSVSSGVPRTGGPSGWSGQLVSPPPAR